jgi:hypothetical protein
MSFQLLSSLVEDQSGILLKYKHLILSLKKKKDSGQARMTETDKPE